MARLFLADNGHGLAFGVNEAVQVMEHVATSMISGTELVQWLRDPEPMTTWPPTVAEIPANDAGGRDLVFGDIHGFFATVEAALEDLRYDPKRDRLFSLGDTIDYGPRSADALEWIQSRFACTVRGNHEDMMFDWTVLGERLRNPGGRLDPAMGPDGLKANTGEDE